MSLPPRRILVTFFAADISHHADILSSPDTCVNAMVIYPDGYTEGFMFSRHGVFNRMHIINLTLFLDTEHDSSAQMAQNPNIPILNMWAWIYFLLQYDHATFKDSSIVSTHQLDYPACAPEHRTLARTKAEIPYGVFFCEHDGQGEISRMLCRWCLLSPEL